MLANLNSINAPDLAYQVADIYLADQSELDPFLGNYYSDELDCSYVIEKVDGNLAFTHANDPKKPLDPTGSDTFKTGPIEITFSRDSQEQITGFSLDSPRARHILFSRL